MEEALRDAVAGGDRDRFWLAAKALGPLAPAEVERFAEWARASGDPAAVEMVARMLVGHGGSEGIAAVAKIAGDPDLELKARGVAIEALAEPPPERLGEARDALLGVIAAGLPGKLESHAVHAYGRTFEERAVEGLAGLLEIPGLRREAVFHAMRDFARAGDIPLLSGLLESTSGREEQEILIRALGNAAGAKGGELLLGLLGNPPAGVRRDAIGFALEEFAKKEDVPELWRRLETETQRPVQAALARALARAGGAEEVSRLVELAAAPDSPLSLDLIAGALAKNARPENLPVLESALERVRTWEAAEALASEIVRISGKDGAARVLAIAARGGGDEGRRAMIEVVERFGDASSAEALASMLERETDHGVVFHLAKALMRLDPAYGPDALAERIGSFANGDQRAAIADFLERQGNPSIVPALAKAFRAEEFGRAQWHLARAMAALGPSGVETLVGAILEDPNPARRAEALRGFESAAPEAAAELARSL
ncbi:MAG: HEAT repeat domain-containing protein, partial [Planctomycetota bacterium]